MLYFGRPKPTRRPWQTKIEGTVRFLGIEVDDVPEIADKVDI